MLLQPNELTRLLPVWASKEGDPNRRHWFCPHGEHRAKPEIRSPYKRRNCTESTLSSKHLFSITSNLYWCIHWGLHMPTVFLLHLNSGPCVCVLVDSSRAPASSQQPAACNMSQQTPIAPPVLVDRSQRAAAGPCHTQGRDS